MNKSKLINNLPNLNKKISMMKKAKHCYSENIYEKKQNLIIVDQNKSYTTSSVKIDKSQKNSKYHLRGENGKIKYY